jgi:hypothetical protein
MNRMGLLLVAGLLVAAWGLTAFWAEEPADEVRLLRATVERQAKQIEELKAENAKLKTPTGATASAKPATQPAERRQAEEPHVRSDPESLRQRHAEAMAALRSQFPYVPIADWKGLKFQFLEKPLSSQKFGYQAFKGGEGEYGHPTYAEAVGRIGTVTNVVHDSYSYTVSLKLENGKVYTSKFMEFGDMSGVAPLADIEKARRLWKGKTLWTNRKELTTYDSKNEKHGTVPNSRYAPVKVVDVVGGWYDHQPARFILDLASGERG